MNGDKECVLLLVEAGANLEAKDGEGATPLCGAAKSGEVECVRMLVEAGADLEARAAVCCERSE